MKNTARGLGLAALGVLLSCSVARASLSAALKHHASELLPSYDFVIAGGGTCGLTVANRLSAAFPNKTVLVIERGVLEEHTQGVYDPPETTFGPLITYFASLYPFVSLPNPGAANRTQITFGGKVLGGSSAVNGQYHDTGSRFSYDAWAAVAAGDGEFSASAERWDWDGIQPWLKRSVTFTPPTQQEVDKFGYTWDADSWAPAVPAPNKVTGPLQVIWPPFQWPDFEVIRHAWAEMGIATPKECNNGEKEGICWSPTWQDPVTAKRVHAGMGHFERAVAGGQRKNYHVLVGHQVVRVVYPNGDPTCGPPVVEVMSAANDTAALQEGRFNVTATAEVVVSAGTFHTPNILQRSGIANAGYLKSKGIPVVLDLPGVGANLQDHPGVSMAWEYKNASFPSPLPIDMYDPSFQAAATAEFNAVPARGPYTLGLGNTGLYLSLANMTSDNSIVNAIRRLASKKATNSYHLPDSYDSSLIAGYRIQLKALADLYGNKKSPSVECMHATNTSIPVMHMHPLSRGTVRLPPDYRHGSDKHLLDLPEIDYRALSNPLDVDLNVAHVQYLRAMYDTPTLKALGAVETLPGPAVGDDEEKLKTWVRETIWMSYMHGCCTAAMMPKAKGGVVGPELKVHGASGVRVVDMSVMPIIPSAHLTSTAYAVAEKAADMMIRQWRV
ncbi:GMC oxidoreductase [Podospora aff. communis PSN243]|uniref:GMC oxidoreductase n=1 Tax=Podospora aff. communis PSN243 TaxID=3040156 RepID=A0AAV9G0A2_9PEZI|nr:GMC oxidoreductase [Podospora aff. communis PSN243]